MDEAAAPGWRVCVCVVGRGVEWGRGDGRSIYQPSPEETLVSSEPRKSVGWIKELGTSLLNVTLITKYVDTFNKTKKKRQE